MHGYVTTWESEKMKIHAYNILDLLLMHSCIVCRRLQKLYKIRFLNFLGRRLPTKLCKPCILCILIKINFLYRECNANYRNYTGVEDRPQLVDEPASTFHQQIGFAAGLPWAPGEWIGGLF